MKPANPFRPWILSCLAACLALGTAVAQDKERLTLDRQREEHRARFLADRAEPEPQPLWAGATDCVGGMAGVYPCYEVDLLAFMPNASISGGNANDIWGWTEPLTGREMQVFDLTQLRTALPGNTFGETAH